MSIEKGFENKKLEFWEKHFEYYDFFQNQLDAYRDTVNFHVKEMEGAKNIIDTGAGSGNLTKELIEKGHEVTAIDSEPYALEQLKNKIQNNKHLKIVIGDVSHMNVDDESFDGATSMFLLPFVTNTNSYIKEMYRILKSGGKFSISGWSPELDIYGSRRIAIEKEFQEKGILPRYQTQWDQFLETSLINANNIKASDLNKEKLLSLLNFVGFDEIIDHPGIAYDKYAYFITGRK